MHNWLESNIQICFCLKSEEFHFQIQVNKDQLNSCSSFIAPWNNHLLKMFGIGGGDWNGDGLGCGLLNTTKANL